MQNFLWIIYGNYSKKIFYQKCRQCLQANDKLYEGVELPTKNIRSSTKHQDYQESTWVNDGGWKRCLGGGNIKSHQHFQVIIFLHQRVILKGTWKTQFFLSSFYRLGRRYFTRAVKMLIESQCSTPWL